MLAIPFSAFFLSSTVPLIWGAWLSLFNADGLFVGLGNYVRAFRDPSFLSSMAFTFIYAGSVTVSMVVGKASWRSPASSAASVWTRPCKICRLS
jgi:ABC-type sugar transport system permease subunit